MKKVFASVLAILMVFSMFGCGKGNKENNTPAVTETSLEMLTKVWEKVGEGLPVIGGDFNADGSHLIDNAPGVFDISNTDALTNQLYVPENAFSHLKDCASVMHMMNANTLTVAFFKVDGMSDFGTTMANTLKDNHWMCGMPEKVYVAAVGSSDFVVAFGVEDIIADLDKTLTDLYGNSVSVVCNEALGF